MSAISQGQDLVEWKGGECRDWSACELLDFREGLGAQAERQGGGGKMEGGHHLEGEAHSEGTTEYMAD